MEYEGESLAVKPMNCPNHCLMYKEQTRSYRDLPIRFAEYGPLSRYELSGTLHGLMRVRGFHQDDAHLYVREDQIEQEIFGVLELFDVVYSTLGLKYSIKLSTRPEKFLGTVETWDRAEQALMRALEKAGGPTKSTRRRRLYGPKLDIYVTDALERVWQCHGAAGLPAAGAVRPHLRGCRRQPQAAGDDPPGHLRVAGAVYRDPGRALRRSVPHVARPV